MGDPRNADPGRIKGAAFREFVAWWERSRGPNVVRAAHASLPSELASQLDPNRDALGILASTWYPAAVTHALVDALIASVPEDRHRALADEGAEAVMAVTLRGVYKAAFALLATPERYAKYNQKIWDMHYDTGTASLTPDGPNAHRSVIAGWRGHHAFICRLNMASSIPIYRAMGFHAVTYEVHDCIARGGEACISTVRWR